MALVSATSTPASRRALFRLSMAAAMLALAVSVWGGYERHWGWTGFSGNDTLWDWLKLLLLPISLAALPLWLRSRTQLSRDRRLACIAAPVAFGVLVLLGYVCDWRWTGFSGNTLWDWLELLVLPITVITIRHWTTERTVTSRHLIGAVATALALGVFIACAYLLPIGWSGFSGNTFWDWAQLLMVPLLMPLVLVPAVTKWVQSGIASDANPDPAPTTTYDIWLSPTQKLTAQVVPGTEPGSTPMLVVPGTQVRVAAAVSGS